MLHFSFFTIHRDASGLNRGNIESDLFYVKKRNFFFALTLKCDPKYFYDFVYILFAHLQTSAPIFLHVKLITMIVDFV